MFFRIRYFLRFIIRKRNQVKDYFKSKLCQVYLECSAEVISPEHLFLEYPIIIRRSKS